MKQNKARLNDSMAYGLGRASRWRGAWRRGLRTAVLPAACRENKVYATTHDSHVDFRSFLHLVCACAHRPQRKAWNIILVTAVSRLDWHIRRVAHDRVEAEAGDLQHKLHTEGRPKRGPRHCRTLIEILRLRLG